MSKKAKSLVEIATSLVSLVALIASLSRDYLPVVLQWPRYVYLVIFVTVGAIAVHLWFARNPRRQSSLRNPRALTKDFLYGRERAATKFCRLCEVNSIIFLVGDSGTGKSAFLEMALVPELARSSTLTPLSINLADTADWDNSLRNALVNELRRAGQTLHQATHDDDNIADAVRRLTMSGRTPCVVFDQFDDYLFRHEHLLFRTEEGVRTPLTPAELEHNSFWGLIARLVRQGNLHALFAARDAVGSSVVEFVKAPPPFGLEPLDAGAPRHFLESLTVGSDPAIDDPDQGWNQLKSDLIRDLAATNTVLPARMKMAFQGLLTLEAPTLDHYNDADRLPGLERAHVLRAITQAADKTKLEKRDLSALLVRLVDKVDRTSGHSRPVPLSTLVDSVAKPLSEVMIEEALVMLHEQHRLVRPTTAVTHGWQLYHDYLTAAVLDVDDRLQEPHVQLRKAFDTWKSRPRFFDRWWRSLLGPANIFQLARNRWRLGATTFPLGDTRWFVLRSLIRFAPIVLVLLFIVAALWWVNLNDQVVNIVASFDGDSDINQSEHRALWQIADGGIMLRRSVIDRFFENSGNAGRWRTQGDHLAQALIGRRPTGVLAQFLLLADYGRPHLRHRIASRCFRELPSEPAVMRACASAAAWLSGEFSDGSIVQWCLTEASLCDDEYLTAVLKLLRPEDIGNAAASVLASPRRAGDPYWLRHMLLQFPPLTPLEADNIASDLSRALDTSSDGRSTEAVGAIEAIGRSLTTTKRREILEHLVAIVPTNSGSEMLGELCNVISRLADSKYDRDYLDRVAAALTTMASAPLTADRLVRIASALQRLNRASGDERVRMGEILLRAAETAKPSERDRLYDTIDQLNVKDQALTAKRIDQLARQATNDVDELDRARALAAISKLDKGASQTQRRSVANALARRVLREQNSRLQLRQFTALQPLIDDVDPLVASGLWREYRLDARDTGISRQVLSYLARRLTPGDVTDQLAWATVQVRQSSRPYDAMAFAGLGVLLSGHAKDGDVRPLFDLVTIQVKDPAMSSSAADLLKSLTVTIPEATARSAVKVLVERFRASDRPYEFLGSTARMIEQLSPEDAAWLWDELFRDWLKQPQDTHTHAVASLLVPLAARLKTPNKVAALNELVAKARLPKWDECVVAAALVTEDTSQEASETILEWPTCSLRDRNQLGQAIEEKWRPQRR